MPKKRRPEFAAWERLMIAQIKASQSNLRCLEAEVRAQKGYLVIQLQSLSQARIQEDQT